MPSQRPYFLSSFIAAFRPQGPSLQAASQQPNKHTSSTSTATATTNTTPASSNSYSQSTATTASPAGRSSPGVAIHSPRNAPSSVAAAGNGSGIPIPGRSSPRRRGSDSSSEGFRDVLGADKWYIGGRTAAGEEKFFKLGVVRRVKSNDGLSLDRLSL